MENIKKLENTTVSRCMLNFVKLQFSNNQNLSGSIAVNECTLYTTIFVYTTAQLFYSWLFKFLIALCKNDFLYSNEKKKNYNKIVDVDLPPTNA